MSNVGYNTEFVYASVSKKIFIIAFGCLKSLRFAKFMFIGKTFSLFLVFFAVTLQPRYCIKTSVYIRDI